MKKKQIKLLKMKNRVMDIQQSVLMLAQDNVRKPKSLKITACRASLVAQWLRICLPTQGTQVRALVWQDPTCRGATRPVSHNY